MVVKEMGDRLRESAAELKSTRTLVYCALMLAIQVILNALVSFTLGPSIRITFGHLAEAAVAALFGPVPAMINAVLSDILVYFLKPIGPYFPGFTLSAALGALIYGLAFYRRDVKVVHILLGKAIIVVLINVLLNSLWLKLLYGSAFFALLPARLLKNAMQYPVDVLLLMPIILTMRRAVRRTNRIH